MRSHGPPEPASPVLPVTLRLTGKLAVVVGGGGEAERAVARLLAAGARVTVAATIAAGQLTDLAARGSISITGRSYQRGDLEGAWLVLACADDQDVNARAAQDAERAHVWCLTGDAAGLPPGTGQRVLVLGGARSGKSATAESMLAGADEVDYVATGPLPGSGDTEWDERVRAHLERRPPRWRTIQTTDVAGVLADHRSPAPVLVDCLATWLARVMDDCGLWAGVAEAGKLLAERTDSLVDAWRQTRRHVVAVSNEVGSGVVPATESGRRFRDELGWLNSRVAAGCDEVWLCTAGIAQRLR